MRWGMCSNGVLPYYPPPPPVQVPPPPPERRIVPSSPPPGVVLLKITNVVHFCDVSWLYSVSRWAYKSNALIKGWHLMCRSVSRYFVAIAGIHTAFTINAA